MVDTIDVVVRCRNEMPHTARTLAGLRAQQRLRARVLFVDCASSDGSREAAVAAGARLEDLAPERYVPGAVLNRAMASTESAIVAFVNADAVPLELDSVALLLEPLRRERDLAATYGRQLARPEASRATHADHARAFGPGERPPTRRGPFFSMAASAVRRSVWERVPFDPTLRYSEDVDWTQRLAALGWRTEYVPRARFEHSHDYDLAAQYKRRAGEGAADRAIYRLGPPALLADLVRPLAGAVVRDVCAGVASPRVTATRVAQALGYFAGRCA